MMGGFQMMLYLIVDYKYLPTDIYLLADAGYSNSDYNLTPYYGVRYHLKEQALGNRKPENKEELFNL